MNRFSNLDQVKAEVLTGKAVHWKNAGYAVREHRESFYIIFEANGSTVDLLNQDPSEFFTSSGEI